MRAILTVVAKGKTTTNYCRALRDFCCHNVEAFSMLMTIYSWSRSASLVERRVPVLLFGFCRQRRASYQTSGIEA